MEIVIAEQDVIDSMEHIAVPFFEDVLQLDYRAVLVTDESTLSDFCFSGLPEGAIPQSADYKQARSMWDRFVVDRIATCYGLALATTSIRLVELFGRIEAETRPRTLH